MKPTIQAMRIREAKDFLVAQTAELAALEGIPLSDIEKRMMYFTESGYVPEDPIKLNEEFEAENDSDKYEAKILAVIAFAFLVVFISGKLEPQWSWLREADQALWHVLFGIFIAVFLAVLFFPRRAGNAMEWLLDHTFSLFGAKEDEKDSE